MKSRLYLVSIAVPLLVLLLTPPAQLQAQIPTSRDLKKEGQLLRIIHPQ